MGVIINEIGVMINIMGFDYYFIGNDDNAIGVMIITLGEMVNAKVLLLMCLVL